MAKRTCFENRADMRRFLAELARSFRRGEIELIAFCILMTHFHLVLRSPRGALSEAMRRVQNIYVRYFNRRRRRDGPLFRGRFWSKPVGSDAYLRLLLRYVDHNAPRARLIEHPGAYPWGSAWHYTRSSGPRWLSRSVVEELVGSAYRDGRFTADRYRAAFGTPVTEQQAEIVKRRLHHRGPEIDPLDDLMAAAPAEVREWMVRKAALADGTRPGLPIADPESILATVESARAAEPDWRVTPARAQVDGWGVVVAGLLRQFAGCTFEEIGARVGASVGSVRKRARAHCTLSTRDPAYASRAALLVQGSVHEAFGVSGAATEAGVR